MPRLTRNYYAATKNILEVLDRLTEIQGSSKSPRHGPGEKLVVTTDTKMGSDSNYNAPTNSRLMTMARQDYNLLKSLVHQLMEDEEETTGKLEGMEQKFDNGTKLVETYKEMVKALNDSIDAGEQREEILQARIDDLEAQNALLRRDVCAPRVIERNNSDSEGTDGEPMVDGDAMVGGDAMDDDGQEIGSITERESGHEEHEFDNTTTDIPPRFPAGQTTGSPQTEGLSQNSMKILSEMAQLPDDKSRRAFYIRQRNQAMNLLMEDMEKLALAKHKNGDAERTMWFD